MARRGWLSVYGDRLECGDWTIAFGEVEEATLYRTRQGLIPVRVLKVVTEDDTVYQFGLNGWAKPHEGLPFDVEERRVRLRLSLGSVLLRVAVIAILLFWILRQLGGG